MNYIKHLNYWFELLRNNVEAKPTHIALYVTLFQQWNQGRFPQTFIINRTELMNLSKIGSKTVYSNCMSDMHRWGWVHYTPSYSNYGSSTVCIRNWSDETMDQEPKRSKNRPSTSPNMETCTETSDGTAHGTSAGTASETANGTASGQEVGHNNKTYKQETDNNKNLKNKYNEPM